MNDQDTCRRLLRPDIVAASFLILFIATSGCVRQQRIAVVDVQRAYQHSPLGMVSAILVRDGMGRSQTELKKRGRALADLRQRLEHGPIEVDPEQRAKIEALIAMETAKLAELQQTHHTRLAELQQKVGEELIQRVERVARDLAEKEGLELLLIQPGAEFNLA